MKKCPNCRDENVTIYKDDFVSPKKDSLGNKIIVKNVSFNKCEKCGESWIASSEFAKIGEKIKEQEYHLLSPSEIKEIRKSLPVKTKHELASMLCLNEKAFVKWEKGYNPMNRANDLLLRLVAFSRSNFYFVKHLHENNFKYNPMEYYFTRRFHGLNTETKKKTNISFEVRERYIGTYKQRISSSVKKVMNTIEEEVLIIDEPSDKQAEAA